MWLPMIPIVVFGLGLLLYLLASNAKAVEIGRIAIFVGLFVTVWLLSGAHVGVFR